MIAHKYRNLVALLSVALLSLLSATSFAADGDRAAAELVDQLQALGAVSGEFHQRQFDSEKQLLSESSGVFSMQRPGMLRWETSEPFPQLLVTNGSKIWMYDPDLEQVTVSRVSQQLSQTPAVIFSGEFEQLNRQYEVVSVKAGQYQLVPRTPDNNFQRLELVIDQGLIREMTLLDGLGQLTEFKLNNVQRSNERPAQDFEFNPPEGVDVFIND